MPKTTKKEVPCPPLCLRSHKPERADGERQDIQIRGTDLGDWLYADYKSIPKKRRRLVFAMRDGNRTAESMIRGTHVLISRTTVESVWKIASVVEAPHQL